MQNTRLDDSQAGIKMAGRNITTLRYAGDPTLMAESKEEVKRASWWGWKSEVKKTGFKLNIQTTKIMAYGPKTPWQTDGEK